MAVGKRELVIVTCMLCSLASIVQMIEFPAEIGAPCTDDDRCTKFIPDSVCKEDICTCLEDFIPHPTNKSLCLQVAQNIRDPCVEHKQCTDAFGVNAVCSEDGHCVCKPQHHYVLPKSCQLDKGLDEECSDTSECYLPTDGDSQNIECVQKVCKCLARYTPSPDKLSCRGSAVTNIISLTGLVGVWILHLWV